MKYNFLVSEPRTVRRRLRLIRRIGIVVCSVVIVLSAVNDALWKTSGSMTWQISVGDHTKPAEIEVAASAAYAGWGPPYSRIDLRLVAMPSRSTPLGETGFPWLAVERVDSRSFIFRRVDGTLTPPIEVGLFDHTGFVRDDLERRIETLQPGRTWFFTGSIASIAYRLGARLHILLLAIIVLVWVTREQVWIRLRADQCPQCGYDLHGLESPGCPECGWRRGDDLK